jgi:hypothetical protein
MAEGGLPDFARPLTIQVMRISNYTGFYPLAFKNMRVKSDVSAYKG